MHKIILSILVIIAGHCYAQQSDNSTSTLYLHCVTNALNHKRDTVQIHPVTDSITTINSLKTALFLSNYKLAKAKYYLSIVNKKPSQIVYLKGWLNRILQ